MPIASVTVFTGSASGVDQRYAQRAAGLGSCLAERGLALVYGGGDVGLMGAVADAALNAHGAVVGVMPQSLFDREIAHTGLTRLEVVADMHERKTRMANLGDAFVALPGGVGTLEEFFEAWTWQQLGLHAKPVGLCDATFWAPLVTMLDHMVEQGFVRRQLLDSLVIADDPEDVIDRLCAWTPSNGHRSR